MVVTAVIALRYFWLMLLSYTSVILIFYVVGECMYKGHDFVFRVYSEDTDLYSMVYHANYLRFYERARTEMFRDAAVTLSEYVEKGV